jgi:hypothetical protein
MLGYGFRVLSTKKSFIPQGVSSRTLFILGNYGIISSPRFDSALPEEDKMLEGRDQEIFK